MKIQHKSRKRKLNHDMLSLISMAVIIQQKEMLSKCAVKTTEVVKKILRSKHTLET